MSDLTGSASATTAGNNVWTPGAFGAGKADPNAGSLLKTKKANGEKLLGWFGKDLNFTGGWTLHGEEDSVSGAADLFTNQNLTGLDYRSAGVGGLEQTMDMTVQGKVLNVFNVDAHFSNSRYGSATTEQYGFDYREKGTVIDAGTVNASLSGNELVPFSRSVEGIMFSRDFGNHDTTADFVSITKSDTQHGSFQGTGTSGPYYLNASSLIPGSEHVQLNGKDLVAGTDYTIDYTLGQISFLKGVIVNATDTVQYTYEAQSYNTAPGLLMGTRMTGRDKSGDDYGLTIIKQKPVGYNVNHNGTVTQYFPVYGVAGAVGGVADPEYHYVLASDIDTSVPLVLKWQNETLTLNVDYVLNVELHYFQLKRALPADTSETGIASLSCTYKPILTESVAGNKEVYGLDSRLRLSPSSAMTIAYAGSAADVPDQTGNGTAITYSVHSPTAVKKNAWDFSASLKNIGQNFSSIDSTSTAFMQAQKGLSSTFKIQPNSFYSFSTSISDNQVAVNTPVSTTSATGLTTTTNEVGWSRNQSLNSILNIAIPKLPTIAITHQQTVQDTSTTGGGKSTFDTDSISASWTKGIYNLSGAVTDTSSQGVSVFSSAANNSVATATTSTGTLIDQANNGTFAQTSSGASALSTHVSLSVTPKPWISVNTDYGVSKNRTSTATSTSSDSGSATDTTARNYGWGVNLQPLKRLTLAWTFTDSTNGESTAAFTNSATASAAAGTSAASAQLVDSITGQETRSNNVSLQYAPIERLSVGISRSTQLSLIPGQDNSDETATSFSLTGSPTRKIQLGFLATEQSVTYVGGEGSSNNSSETLTSTAGPYGKISVTSSLMHMDYGSATYTTSSTQTTSTPGLGTIGTTGTQTTGLLQEGISNTLSLELDYAIGGNRTLFGRWRGLDQGAPGGGTGSTTVGDTTGSTYVSTNYFQGTTTVGFSQKITDIVGFTVNFNLIDMMDRENPSYSYHARTITTDLSARF